MVLNLSVNLFPLIAHKALWVFRKCSFLSLFNNYKSYDKSANTKKLYNLIDSKLVQSYNVFVDRENIIYYNQKHSIDVAIPVEYSIKYEMFMNEFDDFIYDIKENSNSK